jgi:CopG family nickel-responsive transcriptional regulator
MTRIIRFGVSMEEKLLKEFDALLAKEGYKNRSEAIRGIIRERFVEEEWEKGEIVAGCIMMVYDHRKRELVQRITDVQHDFHHSIISSQHVHMDHDNCLEIIVLKGMVENIQALFTAIKSLKGIKYVSISRATTGSKI